MASYNTTKIENWYNDFVKYKRKFDNEFYSGYTSSYIKKNYNDVNNKIRKKLDGHYEKIKKLYDSIDTYWKNLIDDIKNADQVLAGNKTSGCIHSSTVVSALNKLPKLKEYEVTLDTRFSSFLANVGASETNQWIEENITWNNAVVCITSLYRGGYKVWETIGDGLIWWYGTVLSTVTSIFSKEFSEKIQDITMDITSYDILGAVNDFIYQDTEIGRTINEGATMKYDSESASKFTKFGQETLEFVLATTVTYLTGGIVPSGSVSALLGFLSGGGESAENNFQEEDRSFWGDAGEIIISGGISSVEWYSEGKMGDTILNLAKIFSTVGPKVFLQVIKNSMLNTKAEFSNGGIKAGLKFLWDGVKNTVKDVDTWVESIGAAFNNISYDKENGFQVDWENFRKESVRNLGINYVSNTLIGKLLDFKTPNAKLGDVHDSYEFKDRNITNFKDRVNDKLTKTMDRYNRLVDLKARGVPLREGTLKQIELDEKTIKGLMELTYDGNIVTTKTQKKLFDAMDGSIEEINNLFASQYGPDAGIRQVEAYANGKIGIEYIPEQYREIISSYSQEDLLTYFKVKKKLSYMNEFINEGYMTEKFTSTFSRYVDADKIAETATVNIFVTGEAFELLIDNSKAMAFNDGSNSYMNIIYIKELLAANTSHESIHQMSANNGKAGIKIDENHRGINETFTEYLNKLCLGDSYPKIEYSSYQPMVSRLEMLVENKVLTNDDIMSSYFGNDITVIKNKVNLLSGSNDYYDRFVDAFAKAHGSKDYTDLDSITMELVEFRRNLSSGSTTL